MPYLMGVHSSLMDVSHNIIHSVYGNVHDLLCIGCSSYANG